MGRDSRRGNVLGAGEGKMTDIALGTWKLRSGAQAVVRKILVVSEPAPSKRTVRLACGSDHSGNPLSWWAGTGKHAFGGYVKPGTPAFDLVTHEAAGD